ncbi:VC0807 family protein [Mesorhizobium huakuii]|uniref:VC0807 family protein n=1 Tax=Mesorhizobium huakuii TaxID=28104 RepID=UPI001AEDBEFA|nr:VC0807 family protein [Mesorhizobium huakuii]
MRIRAGLVVELGVNLLLPWLAYRMALPHFGTIGALYASAVPPVAWGLIEFARFRRVDALSALVLLGIALSLMVMALGGSARLLLLRESLVSGAIGVVFLLSLAFRKPMVFYLARATVAREREYGQEHFEALWRERPSLRTSIRLMTLIWGLDSRGDDASQLARMALAHRAVSGRFAGHRLRHLRRANALVDLVSNTDEAARGGCRWRRNAVS